MKISYIDLSQASVQQQFPLVTQQRERGELKLPAVFADDRLVSVGYIDYYSIAGAIEQARTNGHS